MVITIPSTIPSPTTSWLVLSFLFDKEDSRVRRPYYPKKGDHLVTKRLGYTHHGLYCGDGHTIHYAGLANGLNSGPIENISFDDFCNGKEWYVLDHENRKYDVSESVKRANDRIGETKYNVIFNNCEHFVWWCIEGKKKSEQVQKIIERGVAASIIIYKERRLLKSILASDIIKPATSELGKTGISAGLASIGTGNLVASSTVATTTLTATSTTLTTAAVAAASTSFATPVAAAATVGYGIYKIFDWLTD